MAVRFYCPECKKPLEVDDADAGKQVLCFYCRTKVAVPVQTDLSLAAAVPGPVDSGVGISGGRKSSGLGVFGLGCSIVAVAAFIIFLAVISPKIIPLTRSAQFQTMSPEQRNEAVMKELQGKGHMRLVAVTSIAFLLLPWIGMICSIAAIITKRGVGAGIAGLIISGLVLAFLFVLYSQKAAVQAKSSGPPATTRQR